MGEHCTIFRRKNTCFFYITGVTIEDPKCTIKAMKSEKRLFLDQRPNKCFGYKIKALTEAKSRPG